MALRVNIKSNIKTQLNDIKKHRVSIREDQTNSPGDQQRSQLEIDSVVSSSTSDVAVLAEAYIDKTCTRFIKEYGIDRTLYESIWHHNLDTHVSCSILNKLVLEIIFNRALSGVSGISYLRIHSMAKLIAVTQLLCFSLNLNELAHAITAVDSTNIKSDVDIVDQKIVLQYTSAEHYVNYVNKINESSMGTGVLSTLFQERVVEIVNAITSKYYLCNTSPAVYNEIGSKNTNGKVLKFSEGFINELCYLLLIMWPDLEDQA